MQDDFICWANDIAQMFAAGALLATTFLLILPESMHHMRIAHPTDDVLQNMAVGGTTVSGIVVSMIISMVCSLFGKDIKTVMQSVEMTVQDYKKDKVVRAMESGSGSKGGVDAGVDGDDGSVAPVRYTKPFCLCRPREWTSAAWTILVGDFFHNVADGIAIGVAFRTCDPAFGWVVTIGAIGHEVSQEVADFILLITKGNMSVGAGVAANLLSGTSCIIGAIVASYVPLSDEAVGGLLGFSGGVYIWAAAVECIAPLVDDTNTPQKIVLRLFSFAIGAVCIGLVLLNHVHCEVGGAAGESGGGGAAPSSAGVEVDPHAGHGH